ncbi:TPA: LuxR C-terminal-related transcriptional regulator [Elizabethkingia meningoseptica]
MKNKIPPIDAERFYKYYKVDGDNSEKNYFELFSETIENIKKVSIAPYFWFISDNIKMRTRWVSENIDQFTPFSNEEWLSSDSAFFINLFHPDDRPYLMAALEFATKMHLNMFDPGNSQIYFNFYSRMIDKQGKYRWILLQSPQQHQNEDHKIESSLVVIYDLAHFQISSMPLLSIIDHQKKEIQYLKHFDRELPKIVTHKPNITKREREVLMLMAKGLKTPEIAEKLSIAYYTVENHKQNLRKKTNTRTASELIAYTMAHSLLLL